MRREAMNRDQILAWLTENDAGRLERLWHLADDARRRAVGDQVHLRGLIEISNHCARQCWYCGLRARRTGLPRYRMSAEEILAAALKAAEFGYGTVVLQSGEDHGLGRDFIADIVRRIKDATQLAVTLSLGERSDDDLAAWRRAGADRYLLRFETSNRALYDRIHPPLAGRPSDRIAMLRRMRDMGYEIGSGVMVGIPGQTYDDLARDVELFGLLDLDMIGVGPFLPHPDTPLGRDPTAFAAPGGEQVPNTELMTYKVVALARLVCPRANIPSTTALATVNPVDGHELGLRRGGNVVMPNLTPTQYRERYEIYPGKARGGEYVEAGRRRIEMLIEAIGRQVGRGPGGSRRMAIARTRNQIAR